MSAAEITLAALAVLGLAVVLLWRRAARLDALHRAVLRSRTTLEQQLAQRHAAAQELASSGALDPAETLLVTDVTLRAADATAVPVVPDGLAGPPGTGPLDDPASAEAVDRALVESELSRTLRAVLGGVEDRALLSADPRTADVLDRLDQYWYRLQLVRRFHNSHVEQARRLRADPVVRLFHLAGHAPLPEPFDMDDARPE